MAKPQVVIIEFADSLGFPMYGVGLGIDPDKKIIRLDSFESYLEAEDFCLIVASHGDCEFAKKSEEEDEVYVVDLGDCCEEQEVEYIDLCVCGSPGEPRADGYCSSACMNRDSC